MRADGDIAGNRRTGNDHRSAIDIKHSKLAGSAEIG
jgi:hypothetical protein